ncbi:MAG: type II toxin-antitoxin system death-on-curing family toxin [Proteobacteria bacterium]|nr:type II toxin-antitoxin system death-on-curing family toxin [Pseudomonadota bacterium]
MSSEPIWLQAEVVRAIHDRQLSEHGGMKGVRDEALLESAVNAPKQKFYYKNSPIEELAASYAYSLCSNHPFLDGNKRTAFVCLRLFLLLNGFNLEAEKEGKVKMMLNLAAGGMDFSALIKWVKEHSSSPDFQNGEESQ